MGPRLGAGASPESCPLPGSFRSSHTCKHGFASRAWIYFRHSIYIPQRGRSRVTGDRTPHPHRPAAVEGQLLPLVPLSSGDKGKSLTGLGGPGSSEPWSYSWVLWAGGGSGAWVVLEFTIPLLLGTAGFRLPLKLVLSVTLTGTAIYQVCPASVMPFASGPLLPTPTLR